MGNTSSTEAKVGGGILAGVGVVLAFTPAGPFTSPWMIPLGANIAGKADIPIGPSVSYSDDGYKVHFGNPDNIERERDYRIEQNKLILNINKMVLKEKIEQMNQIINEQINKQVIKDLLIVKSNFPDIIKTWEFDPTNITLPFIDEYLNNTVLPATVVNEKTEYIGTLYVARRNLSMLPFNIGFLAHSGLLLKTNKGTFYVLEYGVEKNKVTCTKIDFYINDSDSKFKFQDKEWSKQIKGTDLKIQTNITEMQELMESKTGKLVYNMFLSNCHMAQERLRKDLGMEVNNPYIKEDLERELQFMMMMDR